MDNKITITKRFESVDGRHYATLDMVEWRGTTARISADYLDDFPQAGDFYEIGPYIAELVADSYDPSNDTYLVAKVEHPMAWIYVLKFRLARRWAWYAARLIYTLAIWELADMPRFGDDLGWHLVRNRWAGKRNRSLCVE